VAEAGSGELLRRPGGANRERGKGEEERKERGISRHKRGKLLPPESMGFNRGGENARSDHGEK
jgi:hypothetical protein